MGRVVKGLFAGVTGKIGNVVLIQGKQGTLIREAVERGTMNRNPNQDAQFSKIKMMSQFLSPLVLFLRKGFCEGVGRRSAFNLAMSYNLHNALTGSASKWAIDYQNISVSRGSLLPAAGAAGSVTATEATFTWENNGGRGSALDDDEALVMVLNTTKGEHLFKPALGAKRADCKDVLPLHADWKGDRVALYLGFASADGKLSANSVFLGEMTVE